MQWSWSKEFTTNTRIQLVQHLQTNSQLLPSKIEFDHHVDELERFGTLIDRAEAKLNLLTKK
jgi:ubiquinone biosynthesis protein UbiJ